MKYFKFLILSVFMSLFFACSSDDDSSTVDTDNSNEISNEPFSGIIDGEEYAPEYAFGYLTFKGVVDGEFVDNDGVEKLEFFLSDLEFDCSTEIEAIRYDVTGTIITSQLGFQTAGITTMADGVSSNETGGLVELVSINAEEAIIKVKTSGDTFALEGKFTVTICP